MIAKRHIKALQIKLADIERSEARLQERWGDRVAGSMRASEFRLAEALRAALSKLAPPPLAAQGKEATE